MSAKTKVITTFTVTDLEKQIWELEKIRVVIRANSWVRFSGVSYADAFSNACPKNKRLTTLASRIERVLSELKNDHKANSPDAAVDPKRLDFAIVSGTGSIPARNTNVGNIPYVAFA